MKTCAGCGQPVDHAAQTCSRCGLSLVKAATPPPPPPPATDDELEQRGQVRCEVCKRPCAKGESCITLKGVTCPRCAAAIDATSTGSPRPVDGTLWLALCIGVAFMGAGLWLVSTVMDSLRHGSCPHVYAFDGEAYHLDADPLSGAFLRAAERDDLIRLEHARPVDGRYRLEIRDELPEKDAVDAIDLRFVDHDPSVEVLPTQDGAVLGLARAAPPTAARDGSGADRLAALVAPDDGVFVAADADPGAETATVELTFPRPEGAASLALALRAHGTPFAEEALARYVGAMGPGLAPLLEWADDDSDQDFRDRLHDEIRRLGLPLAVEVDTGHGFRLAVELGPVGPAVQRTQAVPLPDLPPGPVRVRLRWTPRFWAIDAARLGAAIALDPAVSRRPIVATGPAGSVLQGLQAADGERVVLSQGHHVALEIEAPPGPAEGRARTVLVHLRGYYEVEAGGGRWINPGVLLANAAGTDSLPRFAARLAHRRPDLVAAGVR